MPPVRSGELLACDGVLIPIFFGRSLLTCFHLFCGNPYLLAKIRFQKNLLGASNIAPGDSYSVHPTSIYTAKNTVRCKCCLNPLFIELSIIKSSNDYQLIILISRAHVFAAWQKCRARHNEYQIVNGVPNMFQGVFVVHAHRPLWRRKILGWWVLPIVDHLGRRHLHLLLFARAVSRTQNNDVKLKYSPRSY